MRKNITNRPLLWFLAVALAAGNVTPALAQNSTEIEATETETEESPEAETEESPEAETEESTEAETEESTEAETEESTEAETEESTEAETEESTEAETEESKEAETEESKEANTEDTTEMETEGETEAGKGQKPEVNNASPSTPKPNKLPEKEEFAMTDMPEIGTESFTEWFFEHTDQEELWDYVLDLLEDTEADDYDRFMEWIGKNEARFSRAYKEYTGIDFFGNVKSSATGDLWDEWTGAKMNWDGSGTELDPYKITTLSEFMGLSESVAQGEDFAGKYFELQSDIDLGGLNLNDGCWNPIGWFKNVSDLGGKPDTAFSGTFDGAGNTISGLRFTKIDHEYSYLGLFGYLKNATVKNLYLEAEEVSGDDNIAILAGCVEGKSAIHNVTVNGFVYAKSGDAGAIAGEMTGGTQYAVVENCIADDVSINSQGTGSFVGGIVGNAQKADIVDVQVITQDGDSNRIQGKGYVGGVAGRQNKVNIYNSYVSGTIGGNLGKAVGGITGIYESGNLIVAQFDGEISRTNQGTASHEGTFIGTREARNSFKYGTGKNDNVSFLYAGNEKQAKNVIGSSIQDDNTWTMEAHIGYFTDYQRKYTKVAGTTQEGSGSRYFYEELEDGIQYIITQKLGKDLTIDYAKGEAFKIDHYAPGTQGEPVKGYLVSIPRIDTKNANGTYDNDVATLTAISSTNNSYYRQIDKDHPSAVAPGCTITVATAAKNKDGNRYQMVYDENEPGKVKPPTYTDEESDPQPMTYMNGGSYTFDMPECDTELNVEYVKVTTELAMSPAETTISVTHTRTGDRKNPKIITEVRDEKGKLIAKYINDSKEMKALPVSIHAEHNGAGASADRTVEWSIDDTDLLHFEEGWTGGYTTEDARIVPNINSEFIQQIIRKEVQAQADANYSQPIKNTIYTDTAVVTAASNPATSVDNKTVTGTCKVDVTFQIIDQTTVRVEGLVLNQNNIQFEVVRKLTGDRKNPVESYFVTEPVNLDAKLNPSQPFFKNVTWTDKESGKIISLSPSGNNQQSCAVSAIFDPAGKNHPAWIQNIVNEDNSKYNADGGYMKRSGTGSITETVTATSEDQTHGVVSADCTVTVTFRTQDETVIHPEGISLNHTKLDYDLSYTFKGDTKSEIQKMDGFGERDILTALVLPSVTEEEGHTPYNRTVQWTSSDPDAILVLDGKLVVHENAQWVQDALKTAPYKAEKAVTITATSEDGGKTASCDVSLKFHANAIEADRESESFQITLTKTGKRSDPVFTWSGNSPKHLEAQIYTDNPDLTKKWSSSDASVLSVSEDGTVTPIITDTNGTVTAEWIKSVLNHSGTSGEANAAVLVSSSDGAFTDTIPVNLHLTVVDQTQSSSGGGGGGGHSGGGGGGAGSSGAPGGTSQGNTVGGPSGAVTGTWTQDADGNWLFTADGHNYTNEWAYIYNPYAADGQNKADWFRFDENGHMVTGWYQNTQGDWYYLNPISDNTLGRMFIGWNIVDGRWRYFEPKGETCGRLLTGWQWIDGNNDGIFECYYLDPSDRGAMAANGVTPDGYTVDIDGRYVIGKTIQTKKN